MYRYYVLFAALLLLAGCAMQEGDEARKLPFEPELPEYQVVQDTLGPKFIEARVIPGQDPVASGTFLLTESYDSLRVFAMVEYQGEVAGHDSEVVAIGFLRSGDSNVNYASLTGCIGIPDTQEDADPLNDNGTFERYAGVVLLGNINQPTEFTCIIAHALDVPGSCFTGTASYPNDVGVESVTLIGYRTVPIP